MWGGRGCLLERMVMDGLLELVLEGWDEQWNTEPRTGHSRQKTLICSEWESWQELPVSYKNYRFCISAVGSQGGERDVTSTGSYKERRYKGYTAPGSFVKSSDCRTIGRSPGCIRRGKWWCVTSLKLHSLWSNERHILECDSLTTEKPWVSAIRYPKTFISHHERLPASKTGHSHHSAMIPSSLLSKEIQVAAEEEIPRWWLEGGSRKCAS
jgi:hypothetical protein